MTRREPLRLISVSTVIIASTLLVLTFVFALILLRSYALTLSSDQDKLLTEIHERLTEKSPGGQANSAVATLADISTLSFRRALFVTITGPEHRLTLYYPSRSDTASLKAVVTWRDGPQVSPQASTLKERIIAAVTSIFLSHSYARGNVRDLEISVRENPVGVTQDISPWLPVLALVILLVLILAYTSGRVLNREALRPLNEVTLALERFAAGDFTPQFISSTSRMPLGRLASAYNGAVAQVEQAFAQRELANASMRQFMSDAGHQLRTPLTVVRGFITVLADAENASKVERDRYLNVLRQQCLIMGTLIDNLILLDRWERQVDDISVTSVDLAQLLTDIINMHADAHPDRVFHFVPQTKESIFARIETHEFHYAISNLLDNAVKYTTGAITIALNAYENRIEITVEDEGPGMTPEIAAHAFDRFSRGERRDVEGSGLGLSIAKRAIERIGGTLQLQSEIAGGSVFTISVPRIREFSVTTSQ